jgi:hypothetical protein
VAHLTQDQSLAVRDECGCCAGPVRRDSSSINERSKSPSTIACGTAAGLNWSMRCHPCGAYEPLKICPTKVSRSGAVSCRQPTSLRKPALYRLEPIADRHAAVGWHDSHVVVQVCLRGSECCATLLKNASLPLRGLLWYLSATASRATFVEPWACRRHSNQ